MILSAELVALRVLVHALVGTYRAVRSGQRRVRGGQADSPRSRGAAAVARTGGERLTIVNVHGYVIATSEECKRSRGTAPFMRVLVYARTQ